MEHPNAELRISNDQGETPVKQFSPRPCTFSGVRLSF